MTNVYIVVSPAKGTAVFKSRDPRYHGQARLTSEWTRANMTYDLGQVYKTLRLPPANICVLEILGNAAA